MTATKRSRTHALSILASLFAASATVFTASSGLATTVGVTAATVTLLAPSGCGGCHDRLASEVATTPDASCAALSVDDVTGVCGAGPPLTLRGENGCAEPLVFSAEVNATGTEITVEPGQPFEIVLAGEEPGDGATVEVPFLRGDVAIVATFTVRTEF